MADAPLTAFSSLYATFGPAPALPRAGIDPTLKVPSPFRRKCTRAGREFAPVCCGKLTEKSRIK